MYKWQFRSVYFILVSLAVAAAFVVGHQVTYKTPKVTQVHPCQGLKGIATCVKETLADVVGVEPQAVCYHEQDINYICEVAFVSLAGPQCYTTGIQMINNNQIPIVVSNAQHSCN